MAVHLSGVLSLDDVTAQGLPTARIGFEAMRTLFVTVEAGDIRMRYDGTLPTPAVGHLVLAGSSATIAGAEAIRHFKAIAVSGAALVTWTGEAG